MGIKWNTSIILFLEIILALNIVSSNSVPEVGSSLKQNFVKFDRNYEVKSVIQSEDGDVIDCVDIYKQPAFNHPALRNHTIQMAPTMLTNTPKETLKAASEQRGKDLHITAAQVWHRSGCCPEGTIPILRRKPSNTNATRKKPNFFPHQDEQFRDHMQKNLLYANRSVSILLAEGFAFYGAKGDMEVWNPHVDEDDEYSISLVALKSGPLRQSEVIESGWAVNPSLYGDRKTRLFVYWTVDGSVDTGCFDHTCPGFVQTNNEIALGAAIYPISNPTGLPAQITITILKDPGTANWWLIYGEKTRIGYLPGKLFKRLFYHAQTVQWGGEVYSTRMTSHPHPATAMGNGRFPDFILGNSGVISRMRVAVNSQTFSRPELVFPYTDEYRCYDVVYSKDFVADPVLYYGGPGRSYKCP